MNTGTINEKGVVLVKEFRASYNALLKRDEESLRSLPVALRESEALILRKARIKEFTIESVRRFVELQDELADSFEEVYNYIVDNASSDIVDYLINAREIFDHKNEGRTYEQQLEINAKRDLEFAEHMAKVKEESGRGRSLGI